MRCEALADDHDSGSGRRRRRQRQRRWLERDSADGPDRESRLGQLAQGAAGQHRRQRKLAEACLTMVFVYGDLKSQSGRLFDGCTLISQFMMQHR